MRSAGPLATLTPIGLRRETVQLQNPESVPDADGGYVDMWTDVAPPSLVRARVVPLGLGRQERSVEGTLAASAGYLVTIPARSDLTTRSRVLWRGRTLAVLGLSNPDEQRREVTLTCTALEPAPGTVPAWVSGGWNWDWMSPGWR